MLWDRNICCAPFADLRYESQQRWSNQRLPAVIHGHSKSIDVLPVSSFHLAPKVVSCHHLRRNGPLQTFNGEEKFFGRILCVSITQISSVQFFLRDCEWFLRGSSFLLFRALVAFRGRWGELHLEVELIEAFDVGAKLMFTIPSDWHVCHGTALQSLLNWWVCCGSRDPGIGVLYCPPLQAAMGRGVIICGVVCSEACSHRHPPVPLTTPCSSGVITPPFMLDSEAGEPTSRDKLI